MQLSDGGFQVVHPVGLWSGDPELPESCMDMDGNLHLHLHLHCC